MKNVLITGGNGDISVAIKQELEKEGNYNILTPSKEILDVTNLESIKKYFNQYKIDILINNAGYIDPANISESHYQNHQRTIDINLIGPFTVSSEALSKNSETFIINIGSSAATKSRGEWSAYCASKAGLLMATECWHKEGVKTICLSPGRTATKMRKALYKSEDPKTLLKPKDFAKVVLNTINNKYELGKNYNVNANNIGELL